MYLMFLGPYEEGGDFRDEGMSGPRRFLDKVWDLVDECDRHTLVGNELHQSIVVKWNQTKKKVTEGLESLSYNTSIAALMELLNALRAVNCTERRIVKEMVIMLAPFAPHFAEECWERLGGRTSVFDASWPTWDEALTVEQVVEIPVQVNGKTRSRVRVPRGAPEDMVVAAARRDPSVTKFTEGKATEKVVYVKDRLLNLVVGP
jgi:leucyl-tRNA synthetase